MITYKEGNLSLIDINTRHQLFQLTLGSQGSMIEPLIKHLPKVIVIAYDGETPVGWIVHIDSRNLSKDNKRRWLAYIAVFVNQIYRGRGIGEELVKKIGEILKSRFDFLVMMPRDPHGQMFFKKIGAKQWKNFPEDDWPDGLGRQVKPIEENQPMYKKGLKHALFLGVVRQGDAVEAVDISHEDAASHYDYRMMYGCRWRYDSGTESVDWTNEPTNDEKFAVETWLNRRGYEIKYQNIGREKRIKKLTEIKQMIIEGVKEKALEDFIKKTIQGTEWQGKVFIAGGYVRDEFMGKDPKDLDLLINAPNGGIEFAKWITKKVGAYKGGATEEDPGSNPVIFPRFGTAKFNLRGVVHNGIDLSDMDIESVMPRKEQYTAGSRKPTVTGGELKDDVERRDFTVNSLLKDLSTGEILDLTGMGKDDIRAGIVRTPLNPDKIFTDDPLRMLRAVRFAVKYNWKLPLFMIRGLKNNASQLKNISQERIRDELNKILITGSPSKGVKLLKITGLLPFVIPELVPAIKMTQNVHHTRDVFSHTLDVVSKTQPILIQRLMGVFHDIGKTVTKSSTPTGVHFYGHELEGSQIVDTVMTRLKYPRELIDAVKLGVKNHMRLKQAGDTAINISDKALRKFQIEMGEQLENVLSLIHADNTSHADTSNMPNQISNIRNRLENLKLTVKTPKLPLNGNDLKEMGIPPGPIYKKLLELVTDKWFENPNISKEEAIQLVKTHMNL